MITYQVSILLLEYLWSHDLMFVHETKIWREVQYSYDYHVHILTTIYNTTRQKQCNDWRQFAHVTHQPMSIWRLVNSKKETILWCLMYIINLLLDDLPPSFRNPNQAPRCRIETMKEKTTAESRTRAASLLQGEPSPSSLNHDVSANQARVPAADCAVCESSCHHNAVPAEYLGVTYVLSGSERKGVGWKLVRSSDLFSYVGAVYKVS